MSSISFPQVVRGLLVAVGILFAVVQIVLLSAGSPARVLDPVLPVLSGAQ